MGDGRRASSTACAGWGSTGTRGLTSAGRTRRISSRSGSRAIAPAPNGWFRKGAPTTATASQNCCSRSGRRQKRPAAGGCTTAPAARSAAGTGRRARSGGCAARGSLQGAVRADDRSPISCTARSRSTTRTSKTSSILRSDRQPTYHLSVVADDIDMAITPRRPRRRSHLEHAEAGAAVRGVRGGASARSRTCR